MGIIINNTIKILITPKKKHMKTLLIISALIATSFTSFSQNICATSFKRNNGNGTCGSEGQLRLSFPVSCPASVPYIDSVYIAGAKWNVTFAAPDVSKCGGGNGYIGYCVTSGNMPPANTWTIFFRLPNGSTYSCVVEASGTVILPVKIVSFDAVQSGNTITCKWETAEEINNNHFELERSLDGINYSTISNIPALQNSSSSKKVYQYSDNIFSIMNNNTVYYRLKQVDNNYSSTYSSVLVIRLNNNGGSKVQIAPNPFIDNVVINFKSEVKGKAEIKIINFSGGTVTTKNIMVNNGSNSIQIPGMDNLSKGIYVVQVSINGVLAGSQRIVKN